LTSRPLTLCRKSVGMSDATRTAGAKRLPSRACSIAPIAAARCMSTAPTTASAFLNTPAHSTPKFLAGHSARPSTVSMKMWYCLLFPKCSKPLPSMRSMTEPSLSVWCRKRSPASRRLATAKQRVSELEVLLCKIYEDNILGKLSDSRYATLDAQYEKEQSELTAEISALEKAIKSYEKHEKDADRFIALIDKYEHFDKLTIAMLNEFIEKILVHERDRKGSIQTTQEVEIYFNFVGRFVPPAFGEVELTPEELEEIRKREERKDRLHQNYLKRKASGAQKRYEDKIKGRKKAEIEAKKAAIRAEDIAKGVFVPVSSLPQREPMKGVQTA